MAWITFGSKDAIISLENTASLFAGRALPLPYFRGIELWLWISGNAAFRMPLPPMLAYKIPLILCDSLIALLLYDSATSSREGLRRGILYAIAPVPLIVCAIHVQTDCLWMYFLVLAMLALRSGGRSMDVSAGAAFVLSVIAKPIAIPLSLVLIPRTRARAVAFISGAAMSAAAYVVVLAATGSLSSSAFTRIYRYAGNDASAYLGLPIRPFSRVWVPLVVAILLTLLHYARRINREEAPLLLFVFSLATLGYAPWYLAWVVPFAILAGHTRFLATFTLASGIALVLFYRMPFANAMNLENVAAFAMLRPFGAWSPPAPDVSLHAIFGLFANYIVPLICVAFLTWRLVRAAHHEAIESAAPVPRRLLVPAVMAAVVVCSALVSFAMLAHIDEREFAQRVTTKAVSSYDIASVDAPKDNILWHHVWLPRTITQPGLANGWLNISTALLIWTFGASAFTARWR